MALKLSNNAISSLLSAITADSTSIILKSGDGAKFPSLGAGDYFPATLFKSDGSLEIVKVTGRSGDTLTATRGQEGTTALSFSAGALIELRLTAATVEDINTITSLKVTTALGFTPLDAAKRGAINGVASLDGSGLVPALQLPSYVDDVLEYANLAAFPGTGEAGKIYVALDTNKTYRWSGSVYIYITSGAVDSVGSYTGVVTAQNLLDAIKTVDGASSGLDADTLDGNHASAFYLATNPSGFITSSGTAANVSGIVAIANGGTGAATATAARTNLGLGTAATTDATAYATATQGANADTAYGWGNHASAGYAADSAVVHKTGNETIAGTKTFSSDASISGLTVGKGGGAVASNAVVGNTSLRDNTTGNNNSAFGLYALVANTTGNSNTGLGSNALYTNTTGASNTGVGNYALYLNSTGSNNTAVGFQAGYSNTTGGNNFYGGYQAGNANTSGWYNTFIGHQAGLNSNVGGAGYDSKNTFIGWSSGSAVTTGLNNSILGAYNGNSGGLDIRTANNYIVLSDGDGNIGAHFDLGNTGYLRLNLTNGRLKFPATQVADSDPNTLDDYEEGTFTPILGGSSGNPTVTYATSNTVGYYTKIGNVVNFTLEIRTTAKSGGSGELIITGLPFAAGLTTSYNVEFPVTFYNIAFNTTGHYTAEMFGTQSYIYIRESISNTTSVNMPISAWTNSSPVLMRVTGSYFTN